MTIPSNYKCFAKMMIATIIKNIQLSRDDNYDLYYFKVFFLYNNKQKYTTLGFGIDSAIIDLIENSENIICQLILAGRNCD